MIYFEFLNALLSKMESVLLFTLCYILFCICFVFPSPEFVSVGLTVESLFSFWLKSELNCFIHYHLRRTAANLIIHSCLPLGYILGIKYISPEGSIWDGNIFLDFLVMTSCALPLFSVIMVLRWHQTKWGNHPIVKNLIQFTSRDKDINRIAGDIANEYRSIDKIIIKCNAITRVIVTNNWIIRIRPYSLNIAHQSDVSVVVSSSNSILYALNGPEGGQYLSIDIKSSRHNVNSFQIRINSKDFKDLQEKMIRPINIMENVDFHGSLTDCFLTVFKEHIKKNPKVLASENLDVCIGCFLALPNVKLMTSCGDTTGANKCSNCYCKPLWCEDCLGKWFASKQDQEKPNNWLSSKATCPMCRSTFCLLDVCPVVFSREELDQELKES